MVPLAAFGAGSRQVEEEIVLMYAVDFVDNRQDYSTEIFPETEWHDSSKDFSWSNRRG
jgi:hypothetical protein